MRIFAIISGLARSAATAGEEEQWTEDAEHGNSDLFQALLISQFPNLTQMTIGYDHLSYFWYVAQMFERVLCSEKAINGLSKFHHLKRVDVCVDMTYKEFRGLNHDLAYLLPFFYLPSIQYLRMIIPRFTTDVLWPTTRPCTKSLTSLSLKGSGASEVLLARILAVTPNLKSLDYDFIFGAFSSLVPSYLCADSLAEALTHVKTTLEQLTISIQSYCKLNFQYEYDDPRCAIKGSLSLHELESLVRLEVPTVVLLGQSRSREPHLAGRLPSRIRWFHLKDDMALSHNYVWRSGATLNILREYLSHYWGQNALLETVGLKLHESKDDWDCDVQGEFRKLVEGFNLTPDVELVRSDA